MKACRTVLAVVGILAATAHLTASGPLAIYGIVKKVVLESGAPSGSVEGMPQ